ncbi:TIGR02391 family protein [Candidatus Poriferisodalis sp.]|uniref:TIGR02391 family protein n=1 Tax=Candidatus Poriferisodalis sp. TaxID=3101277 RepID=UPI003B027059
MTGHHADAVESGVKAFCECVRSRTNRSEDGDPLMTVAFSPNAPLLRINRGRSQTDESEQRGHMLLCQGVVAAWRNPRAHELVDDSPARALMMLELLNDLMTTTKAAVRTRKRRAA